MLSMRRLNILVLNFEYPPVGGGASPVTKEIAIRLKKLGHNLTVVTMGHSTLPLEEVEEGIKIFRIDCKRKEVNISYPIEHIRFVRNAKPFLKRHLTNNSYDVVHCHFILSTGLIARWVKKEYGIPYIITPHGSDLPGFNPDRFKLIHLITPPTIRSILKECSFVVSPSMYLGSLISKYLQNDSNKLKFVPNGISTISYIDARKKPFILSTGRLLRRKGFHTLIQAVSNLESEFVVHICGDGPMMPTLKALAEKSKTKIVFHGWIDNKSEKYQRLLDEASIYVLVSSFENASISLLEAMSRGSAVVTSNVTGCAETVGESGICIAPEDPERLKEVIMDLTSNEALRNSLGNKAVDRIKKIYLWESIVKRYEEIMVECVS